MRKKNSNILILFTEIPRVSDTTYGKNSFKYTAAVLWNDLPGDQFENILQSWNGNECKCNACKQFYYHLGLFIFYIYLYLFISSKTFF